MKVKVTGSEVTDADRTPLYIDDSNIIESVCEFPYRRSVVEASDRMGRDIDRRIAQVPKHLELYTNLSLLTKTYWCKPNGRLSSVCLSVLLYGLECWTCISNAIKGENWNHSITDALKSS